MILEIGKIYRFVVTEEYETTGGEWKRRIVKELDKNKKVVNKEFVGKVIGIYDSHILFHKLNTIKKEGYKESFQKWDLNKFIITELKTNEYDVLTA